MFNRAPTRFSGVAGTPRILLRPLVVVLALLQLAAPVSAAVTDPAPPRLSHTEHIGGPDEKGCEPFHDEAFCIACRVLFSQPLDARVAPPQDTPPDHTDAAPRDRAIGIPDGPTETRLRARAPPRV